MNYNQPIAKFSEKINKETNEGESVVLTLEVFDNGDGIPNGVFTNISINANCYGTHSMNFTMYSGSKIDDFIDVCNSLKEKLENFKREKTL